ncbi:hypothetical protein D3C81_1028910 [compost metagenome]
MGQQIGTQLLVTLQIVVIVRVDIRQNVIHQRFFIVGVDLGRLHLLHPPRSNVHPQVGLFRYRYLFATGFTQFPGQPGRNLAHRVIPVLNVKVRQRITIGNALQRHCTIENQILLTFVRQTNGILRQQRMQQTGKGRHLRLTQDLIVEQRIFGIGQMQLE